MKLRHRLAFGFILASALPALLVAGLHSDAHLKNAEEAGDTSQHTLVQDSAQTWTP